jgi:hypothetical protein
MSYIFYYFLILIRINYSLLKKGLPITTIIISIMWKWKGERERDDDEIISGDDWDWILSFSSSSTEEEKDRKCVFINDWYIVMMMMIMRKKETNRWVNLYERKFASFDGVWLFWCFCYVWVLSSFKLIEKKKDHSLMMRWSDWLID